jgi:hypothetical protein
LKQIHNLPLVCKEIPEKRTPPSENHNIISLSISCEDAGMPDEVFIAKWTKASQLLSEPNSIVNTPGLSQSRMDRN